jgi:hypothetical protein
MILAEARLSYLAAVSDRLDAEAIYAAASRSHATRPTPEAWHALGQAADAVRRATAAETLAQREYDRAYRAACLPGVARDRSSQP